MKSNFFSPKIFLRLGGLCFMLMWIPFIVFMAGLFLYDAGNYKTYNEMPVVMLYSLPAIGLLFFFLLCLLSARLYSVPLKKNN